MIYVLTYLQAYEGDEFDRFEATADSPEDLVAQCYDEFRPWLIVWMQDALARDNRFDKNNYPSVLTLETPLVTETWTLEKIG